MSRPKRLSKAEHAAQSDDERAARRLAMREHWLSKPENMARYVARKKAWLAANKEKAARAALARCHAKYWSDPESGRAKVRAAGRAAYAKDPHSFLLRTQRRRALKRAGAAERIASAEWSSVLDQFNECCAYCLKPSQKLEIDHVEPLDLGGEHALYNLVPACRSCNASKRNSTLLRWLMRPTTLSPIVRP